MVPIAGLQDFLQGKGTVAHMSVYQDVLLGYTLMFLAGYHLLEICRTLLLHVSPACY